MKKYVSWRRVSTSEQLNSRLGLDSQKDIIEYYVSDGEWIADFEEKNHSGTDLKGCVELWKAVELCRRENAYLVLARSDRFRNTEEALFIRRKVNKQLMCCDLPNTDEFTLTLFFALAEKRAVEIAITTKAALARKAKKGEQTGGTKELWGKHSNLNDLELEQHRELSIAKAYTQSAEVRRIKAQNNAHNKAFWFFMQDWQQINHKIGDTPTDWDVVADKLNERGLRTSSGLEFNKGRASSMYNSLTKIFTNN